VIKSSSFYNCWVFYVATPAANADGFWRKGIRGIGIGCGQNGDKVGLILTSGFKPRAIKPAIPTGFFGMRSNAWKGKNRDKNMIGCRLKSFKSNGEKLRLHSACARSMDCPTYSWVSLQTKLLPNHRLGSSSLSGIYSIMR